MDGKGWETRPMLVPTPAPGNLRRLSCAIPREGLVIIARFA